MPFSVILRRVLPWIIATAIAGYVFRIVPIGEAWSALGHARLGTILPIVLGSVLCWFLIDSRTYAYVFSRFNVPVSWREARSLRGVTYLLSPIHLGLGKAALILRLRTIKNVPLLEGASSVALYQTIDALVLASLTAIGLWLVPATPETSLARAVGIAAVLAVFSYLLLLRSRRPGFRLLDRVRNMALHDAHREIRIPDALVMVCAKLAYHLIAIAAFYYGTHAFGIDLPFALALATTPVIQAIGGLPIAPGGLGTQQAAMLYFFEGHGSEAAIVAFGFSLPIAFMVARSLLGLVYLPSLTTGAGRERAGLQHRADLAYPDR